MILREALPGGGVEVSGPLLPENDALIFPAPLKYVLMIPKIVLLLIPKSLKVIHFFPVP